MTSEKRTTTVRMPEALAADLELVALLEGVSASELIRRAVAAHIERRRKDPEFQARLRERIEADQQLLRRLDDADGPVGSVGEEQP